MLFFFSLPIIYSYVPMFGETEYDPIKQFCSVSIEEQLDALGRAVDAGKVSEICGVCLCLRCFDDILQLEQIYLIVLLL